MINLPVFHVAPQTASPTGVITGIVIAELRWRAPAQEGRLNAGVANAVATVDAKQILTDLVIEAFRLRAAVRSVGVHVEDVKLSLWPQRRMTTAWIKARGNVTVDMITEATEGVANAAHPAIKQVPPVQMKAGIPPKCAPPPRA